MTVLGLVGTVHAVPVELTRTNVGKVGVAYLVRPLAQRDARRLDLVLRAIEETEIDAAGILGEDREVDAFTVPGRTERIRISRPYPNPTLTHRELVASCRGRAYESPWLLRS